MLDTQDINWEILKFKHEVLGASLEQIAGETGISLSLLNHCAKAWKPLNLTGLKEISLEDVQSFDELIDRLRDNTYSQTEAFELLKERFLTTEYIELETLIVHKAISIVSSLVPTHQDSPRYLKSMAEVLTSLKVKAARQPEDDEGTRRITKWEITVVDPSGNSVPDFSNNPEVEE